MSYSKDQLESFRSFLDKAKHVLILQPDNADEDSWLSGLALYDALERTGKRVTLFAPLKLGKHLRSFPGSKNLSLSFPDDYDLAILVDIGSQAQFAATMKNHGDAIAKKPLVVIDHHPSHEKFSVANLELVKHDAATCQQIIELAQYFGWQFSQDSIQNLASGIYADTIYLSTDNVTPETLEAMKYLVERGANLEQVRLRDEEGRALSVDKLSLKIKLYQRAEFYVHNKLVICYMTESEANDESNSSLRETVKHDLRKLKSVQLSVMVHKSEGLYNCSMRANIPIANIIAVKLGGGGHAKAASARIEASNEKDAIQKILPTIKRELAKL